MTGCYLWVNLAIYLDKVHCDWSQACMLTNDVHQTLMYTEPSSTKSTFLSGNLTSALVSVKVCRCHQAYAIVNSCQLLAMPYAGCKGKSKCGAQGGSG